MILKLLSSRNTRPWVPELITLIALLACPWVLPLVGVGSDVGTRVLIWGLFGLGFDILFGFTGLLSFGQAAFYGVGGFVTSYLLINGGIHNTLLAMLIGTLAATVTGVVVGVFTLRRSGIYFAMITVAFAEMFHFLELSPLSAFTGGENGLSGVPAPMVGVGSWVWNVGSGWEMYAFVAAFFFIGYVIAHRIVLSPFGQVLTALRDNSPRALATGHSVKKYRLAAFTIAAAYAGVAGGLLGMFQAYMPPDALSFATSGQLVMSTVIGGAGTLFGPLLGSAIWIWLRDVLQTVPYVGAAWKLGLGLVFVILITAFRRGIIGELLHWAQNRARAQRASDRQQEQDDLEPSAAISGRHALAGGVPNDLAREQEAANNEFSSYGGTGTEGYRTPDQEDRVIEGTPTANPWIVPVPGDGTAPALECRHLTKRYGGLYANRDVSMKIPEGQLRAIIGPNGAGKSTFFKMLAGEIDSTEGDVFLHGAKITGLGVTAVSQLGMSKSYQINQLFSKLTVRENLAIPVLARIRGEFRPDMLKGLGKVRGLNEHIVSTMEMVNLERRGDTPVTELAYGEKRRLEIGLALANSPNVLLLDEPLAGMSPAERADTVKLLKEVRAGRTLVIVEHDMDAIFELAEYISVLYEGRLLTEGTPDEIKADTRVQEAYLGGMEEA